MKSKAKIKGQVQVEVRLPKSLIRKVQNVAKYAGVSPTQVYNVYLASALSERLLNK